MSYYNDIQDFLSLINWVTLTEEEREALLSLTKPGKCSSRKVIHSFIRLNADKGEYKESDKKINSRDIASFLKVGERMIDRYNFR